MKSERIEKSGGHKHCGRGDIMFLLVEKLDVLA